MADFLLLFKRMINRLNILVKSGFCEGGSPFTHMYDQLLARLGHISFRFQQDSKNIPVVSGKKKLTVTNNNSFTARYIFGYDYSCNSIYIFCVLYRY